MTIDDVMQRLEDVENANNALAQQVDALQTQLAQMGGDVSTANGGFEVDCMPDPGEPPVLSFAGYSYTSGSVSGVKIKAGAEFVLHYVTLADDGSLSRLHYVHGISGTVSGGNYEISLTDNATNYIYARDAAQNGGGTADFYTSTSSTIPTDEYVYVLVAVITLSSGKVTFVEWRHVGDVHTFAWNLGTYVTSATLDGDLTSGYTLTTHTRTLELGPMYAGGAIT